MTAPTSPPPPDPEDIVWQIEDEDPEKQAGGEVDYDFDAPDPEDG